VRITDYADRMIWPRAAILAELAWSNPRKDWAEFSGRLVAAMERWRKLGLGFDEVPLGPEPTFTFGQGALKVELRQPAGIGTLRYSVRGALSAASPAYVQPLKLAFGSTLSAQAFLGSIPLGSAETWIIHPQLARSRTASEMELCGSAIPIRLEADAPTNGVRLVHWVDVMHPCWIWRGAPLDGMRGIVAQVGRHPFNFSIGDDINKISFRPPSTPAGELEVRRDSCDGPLIASIPLQAATRTTGDAEVSGPIKPEAGAHDLCMTFTQRKVDPFWVLDRLTLQ
jgi:hexosaminidase